MGRREPSIESRFEAVSQRIRAAEERWHRPPGSVTLLAVSKAQPEGPMRRLFELGQCRFGENYLDEAARKMDSLALEGAEWHFIGPLQSNKTRAVAARFDWVQSVDREKIARRLSTQRDGAAGPLNVCVQVNISGEASKSGASPEELPALAELCATLPNLRFRGLMAIPAPAPDFEQQRRAFDRLFGLQRELLERGLQPDTLSMGMSADMEAAIAAGSTMVRVGTALFGPRQRG